MWGGGPPFLFFTVGSGPPSCTWCQTLWGLGGPPGERVHAQYAWEGAVPQELVTLS